MNKGTLSLFTVCYFGIGITTLVVINNYFLLNFSAQVS